MKDPIFWRLVWKEYRLLRGFWIAMAVLAILAQLYVLLVVRGPGTQLEALFAVALTIPALYALGCGATMFATEHEGGTYDFQRSLPISARRLFLGKLGFAALSIPLMSAVLWLLAWALAGWRVPRGDLHLALWGLWGFGAVEALLWGMLFSLVLKQPLKAATIAAAAVSVTVHGLTARTQMYTAYPTIESYAQALPYRAIAAALVALSVFVLASRWFREAAATSSDSGGPADRKAAKKGVAAVRLAPGHSREVAFVRLAWQQWRQSASMLLVLVGMFVPWILFWSWHLICKWGNWGANSMADRQFGLALSGIAALAAVPLAGACVFLADQRKESVRFLAERGVGSTSVWWSRQLVFMIPVLLGTMVVLLLLIPMVRVPTSALPEHSDHLTLVLFPLGCLAGFVLLGYASGQFCSMFLRNGLMAGFLSIVLTVALCGWAGLMWFCRVNWLWSAAPIPFVLLLATWLRSPHWMVQRGGLRGWLRPGLLLAASTAALFAAVATYRAYELPLVDPGFSPEEFAGAATPEARETADMYLRAYDLYVPLEPVASDDDATESTVKEKEDKATGYTEWIEANQAALELALEAASRPTCDVYETADESRVANAGQDLSRLVIHSALRLEREGNLDAALDRYMAAMRLRIHLSRRARWSYWADWTETEVYRSLATWAAQPGQTPERLRTALDELTAVAEDLPSPTDAIKSEYLRLRSLVVSPDFDSWALTFGHDAPANYLLIGTAVLFHSMPWEQARGVRALNVLISRDLEQLRENEAALARGEPVPHRTRRWDRSMIEPWQMSTPIAVDYWSQVDHFTDTMLRTAMYRRGIRLQLALAAWKLEHGELPETLDALVGPYFEELPVDPYAAEPFRYFPQGLPNELTRDMGSPYDEKIEVVAKAGEPFVWSAGPSVVVLRGDKDARALAKYRIGAYRETPHKARTEEEVWSWGKVFTVPLQ